MFSFWRAAVETRLGWLEPVTATFQRIQEKPGQEKTPHVFFCFRRGSDCDDSDLTLLLPGRLASSGWIDWEGVMSVSMGVAYGTVLLGPRISCCKWPALAGGSSMRGGRRGGQGGAAAA